LLPYINRASEKAGIPTDDFIGIAIDGEHIAFSQVVNGEIHSEHLLPFSEYSVQLVIEAFKADTRRAITIDNLMADFAHGSSNARLLMQSLSDALSSELSAIGNSKIKMLFEEWRTLYGQVADMSVSQTEVINQEIGFTWSGDSEQAMSGRLFVIHSYNSLLIKLLAAEIVSAHGLTSIKQPAQEMSTLSDEALLSRLSSDIEHAGIFASAGINGFIEEVIFSWYLDVARTSVVSPKIIHALRNLLASLSMYRTDRLNHTRDVLRDLYQALVPGKLRQSLGEFYTPDWLVDFTVEKTSNGSWLGKRYLDPTCGSGAFLLAVIRQKRKEANLKGWNTTKILAELSTSVWGFDLNPLAVQTARVNFLMEIADLLKDAQGSNLEVPVLLADAIYSPAKNPDTDDEIVKYQIGSQVAGLDIELPAELAFNRPLLDRVFLGMGDSVEDNLEFAAATTQLLAAKLITKTQATEWEAPLKHTYNQILELHRQQWNGIWFRVVRNFFWSATAGEFDYIVGNPPWVRWSKLPEAYRDRVKPTCEHYGIFSNNKRHGGNELDISAMITYTTADKWLKANGRLAFIITGTVFKNASSSGFRQFKISPKNPKSLYLSAIGVDDMKAIKPFNDAANHTAVVVFDKSNEATKYPVPYRMWKAIKGVSGAIPEQLSLKKVMDGLEYLNMEAAPVDIDGSPWAVLSKGRHKQLKALSGVCDWVAGRKGITADLNGVYFVPIIQNNGVNVQIRSRPEAGKKDIGAIKTAWVEPELLYPLIKGAGDFEACYLRLSNPLKKDNELLYTFLPNFGIGGDDYAESAAKMNNSSLVKTKAWFSQFKNVLLNRSTFRRQMKGAPFFAVYNVGEYTLQPWKVIWPEMSTKFYAAVVSDAEVPLVGRRPYIPDHKVYFSGFDTQEPAFYLCGLLNVPMVREWIESHVLSIQMGNIFKHMNLPKFDINNSAHLCLSERVKQAHNEHDDKQRKKLLQLIEKDGEKILNKWMVEKST
jgi:hypothetical protein